MHLVILDPHVAPGQDLRRFDWLGRMIAEERPSVVVCAGDFGTFDSLSQHQESGSQTDRQRPTLQADFDACEQAQVRMLAPLKELNERRKSSKHGPVEIRRVLTLGNHEDRYRRWAEKNPVQASAIDFNLSAGFTYRWEVVPYKSWVTIDGIDYTHVPHNGLGKPVGGVNSTRNAALNSARSCIFGHSHTMALSTVALFGDKNETRTALCGPAFMEDQNIEAYARGSQTGWTYGLLRVRPAESPNRPFSFDYLSMRDLENLYG